VLVDEFQDTSRAQWELVSQLIAAWGEGFGPAHGAIPPSIFIVGDRKQSIYGFRDADVALMDEAADLIAALREDGQARQAITHSFRSAPAILAFVNDVFDEMEKAPERPDAFRYDERDRFPAEPDTEAGAGALGLIAGPTPDACAAAVAAEIDQLLAGTVVRDRATGVRRPAEPGDIAILFRTRETHRVYERALERRGIPTYVYKGLGFFDADEIKDITALVRYLADPWSDLRAAALLRSRFVRVSDAALQRLAPGLARALAAPAPPALDGLDDEDRRVLAHARSAVAEWLRLCDAVPPAELIDLVLRDTAYAFECRGPRAPQARENVKKIRGLLRRLQNRGYLTMARLSAYLERLSAGDESNAVVDALNAVNLMTVHAAKGLEFPIVFLVSLEQPAGGMPDAIRVSMHAEVDDAVAVGDFHTEFDDDAGNRDAEETKRVLYVALTRARDRLYLAASVKDGVFRPGRGGLGAVCPSGVRTLIGAAAAGSPGGVVTWRGPSGLVHQLRACHVPEPDREPAAEPPVAVTLPAPEAGPDDFAALDAGTGITRLPVTAVTAGVPVPGHVRAADSDRLLAGRLVHRLFQFARGEEPEGVTLESRAEGLLHDDERAAARNVQAVVRSAARTYAELRERDDVRQTLAGTCVYEVPFTLDVTGRPEWASRAPGVGAGDGPVSGTRVFVRGVMDCLARSPEGAITVVDFKTGEPRPRDRDQMEVYLEAARHISGGRPVSGRLVYAGHDPEAPPHEDALS
jgi:ATP-dependent exoDNAse (exonuclease V) beta subunit